MHSLLTTADELGLVRKAGGIFKFKDVNINNHKARGFQGALEMLAENARLAQTIRNAILGFLNGPPEDVLPPS